MKHTFIVSFILLHIAIVHAVPIHKHAYEARKPLVVRLLDVEDYGTPEPSTPPLDLSVNPEPRQSAEGSLQVVETYEPAPVSIRLSTSIDVTERTGFDRQSEESYEPEPSSESSFSIYTTERANAEESVEPEPSLKPSLREMHVPDLSKPVRVVPSEVKAVIRKIEDIVKDAEIGNYDSTRSSRIAESARVHNNPIRSE